MNSIDINDLEFETLWALLSASPHQVGLADLTAFTVLDAFLKYLQVKKIMSYVSCPKSKGHNKKHIAICKQCSHRKLCSSYLNYRQPELPLKR